MGHQIHAEIARLGFLQGNAFVASALLAMYAKCGCTVKAREVFDKLQVGNQNVVTWTALITGYVENGLPEEALFCYQELEHGPIPLVLDAIILISGLKACGLIRSAHKGREIHTQVAMKGLERDLLVGSSLVDMYAKCGILSSAQNVFDSLLLPGQDVVSWNSLIVGYLEHGMGEEALRHFEQMQMRGVCPDNIIFVCVFRVLPNNRK